MSDSMPAHDGAASPSRMIYSACPVCGLDAIRDATPRLDNGVWNAYFVCTEGHFWGVRWIEVD